MNKTIALLSIILVCGVLLYVRPSSYTVKTGVVSTKDIPDLSRLEQISSTDITQKLPTPQQGSIAVAELRKSVYFDYMGVPIAPHKAAQKIRHPVGLEIKSGVYRLSDLADEEYIIRSQEGLVVHVPVIIHPEATLIIEGPVVLDTQRATFISNFGKLFVVESVLKSGPTGYKYLWKEEEYRPFIATWNGGETYLADSEFYDLGYNHSKSYGITFSTSDKMNGPPPKGMLIGNKFEGLYYGFYSHEAEEVVIAHNIYKDNIVYGIDPHDYSKELTIAFNDVSGTQRKHGIILSRGVSQSVIYSNKSYQNAGSGIMLERGSRLNTIAENTISDNEGDGLAFLESSRNRSFGNVIEGNRKSGIRARNSQDLHFMGDKSSNNGEYGFTAYPRALSEQIGRNLSRDSYIKMLDFTMIDCILSGNKKAAMNIEDAHEAAFSHVIMLGSPKMVAGDFREYGPDIQGEGIILKRKAYADLFSR